MGFSRTQYIKDVMDRANGCILIPTTKNTDLAQYTDFGSVYVAKSQRELFNLTNQTADTADQYYTKMMSAYNNAWPRIMEQYRIAIGA